MNLHIVFRESIFNAAKRARRGALLFFLLLSACSGSAFPDCCGATGARDTPFSATYLFQYKTGSSDIVDPSDDRLLRIISQADIMTLKNAAATSQLLTNGLIGGLVQGPQGPQWEVALQVTDAAGNQVGTISGPNRNLFYNSLGQVPDFIVNQGTISEGTFTLFNAPPGELFFEAIGGGRGNGRITSFASAVSLGQINVLPVYPSQIGILGVVTFQGGGVPNAGVVFYPKERTVQADGNGLFLLQVEQGLATQAEYLASLSAPGFRDTLHSFNTQMGAVLNRQQAFDPLTIDNIFIFSEESIATFASQAGISLGPQVAIIYGRVGAEDGTGEKDAVVSPFGSDGKPLSANGVRVFYLNDDSNIDPSLKATTNNSHFVLFLEPSQFPAGPVALYATSVTVDLPPIPTVGRAQVYPLPGKIFVQDIPMQGLPAGAPFTVTVAGAALQEDGAPVPAAKIEIVGNPTVFSADGAGAYVIPQASTPDGVFPLAAESDYWVKVFNEGYTPTYQKINTGASGGRRNLTLLSAARMETLCPSSAGGGSLLGTVQDLGLIFPLRRGQAAEGIALKVFRGDGTETGEVKYLGTDGEIASALTATSGNGRFVVCGLNFSPTDLIPGYYQLKVVSQDDSGAVLFQVHPDGVTLLTMQVNKALPREILFSGKAQDLLGPETGATVSVGDVTLSILGSNRRFNADGSGAFNGSLGSNSQYILKAEKEGFLTSYNYQVGTPPTSKGIVLPPVWSLSSGEVASLATLFGLSWSADQGVVAGKVVEHGFNLPGAQVGALNAAPPHLLPGFFNEDSYSDLMAVFDDGKLTFFYGDGVGGFPQNKSAQLTGGAAIAAPLQIRQVDQGDFNLDGRPDLIVIANDKLLIFFGNNLGGFETGEEITLPPGSGLPRAFSVVDLDGDGFLDLVVATTGVAPLVRLTNQKDGTFQPVVGDPTGTCGKDPQAITFRTTGSAVTDFVIADGPNVCILTLNSNGDPLLTQTLPAPSAIRLMAPGVIDGDNISDVVIVGETEASVLVNTTVVDPSGTNIAGTNVILRPAFLQPAGFQAAGILPADVNRDGRADLVMWGSGGTLLVLGNGDGSFGSPTTLSPAASAVTSADFDQDGKIDLALVTGTELRMLHGEETPREGVAIEARDINGAPVGQLFYLDKAGVATQGSATSEGGRFMILNVPPGFTTVRVASGGSGAASVTSYAGSLSYANLTMSSVPPTEILVDGAVINPTAAGFLGVDVRQIHIVPLGTGVEAISGDGGKFQLHLGGNSEYIIKLSP